MKVLIKKLDFYKDPEIIFESLYKEEPYAFWLDSNMPSNSLSRFSFMGCNPAFIVQPLEDKNSFELLEQTLEKYCTKDLELEYDLPFCGGFVGYFAYELHRHIECVDIHHKSNLNLPELNLMFFDKILIIDHLRSEMYLSYIYQNNESEIEQEMLLYIKKLSRIENCGKRFSIVRSYEDINWKTMQESFQDNSIFRYMDSKEEYIKKILQIKSHIVAGDIYQACLTQAISFNLVVDPFSVYRILRQINPAPFSCYIALGSIRIASSSLERFLSLNLSDVLESRPIKGTAARKIDKRLDALAAKELQKSLKECAENVMIVDLVRNDLSKVCEVGSVNVESLMQIEQHPTVYQLVSTVKGKLKPTHTAVDAIKACFPGGSMTGAPKIRAMQILASLESCKRDIYSGCMGYIDIRGSFDLCMSIRSLFWNNCQGQLQVGGGIVYDSDPGKEYQESLDKALAMKRAMIMASSLNTL